MTEQKQQRLKHFKRETKAIGRVILTARDKEILSLVYNYRFIDSKIICALTEGSEQGITKRLQKLYHAGYLDRPREQVRKLISRSGKPHYIYGLADKGAEALKEYPEAGNIHKSKWSKNNRDATERYLDHVMMITNFRATLTLILKDNRNFHFLDWQQQDLKEEVMIHDGLVKKRRAFIIPDAFFILKSPAGKALFFLEADRSTTTSQRYLNKLRAYWHYWKSGKHLDKYGIKGFRVLTITLSNQRRDNLRDIAKQADDSKKGSLMFWFATEKDYNLDDPKTILKKIWTTPADDKPHALFD